MKPGIALQVGIDKVEGDQVFQLLGCKVRETARGCR